MISICVSEGLFLLVSLGIDAFSCIPTVNTTAGAPSRTVPSLTSAEEAQPLLLPGQVLSLQVLKRLCLC